VEADKLRDIQVEQQKHARKIADEADKIQVLVNHRYSHLVVNSETC